MERAVGTASSSHEEGGKSVKCVCVTVSMCDEWEEGSEALDRRKCMHIYSLVTR